MASERQLVAVAGPVGAGKSTLVAGLETALADSTTIQFDHYELVTRQPIEKIRQWMEDGAEIDEIGIQGLAEDLASLKQGRAVVDPMTGKRVTSARYILFETQFGRRHTATGQHIDLLIWVDTPLDIALARKIRQLTADLDDRDPAAARTFAHWLQGYLGNYLDVVSRLLRIQRETVAAGADLIVDGTKDPGVLQREVAAVIRARFE